MTRKPQRTPFSGEPTNDPSALDAVLAQARSVRVTPRGCLVYPVDPNQDAWDPDVPKFVELTSEDALAVVRDANALRRLRDALAVTSFYDFLCMCPGDLALEFLDEDRKRVTVVRVDLPSRISWPLWRDEGVLADPGALASWLHDHGVPTEQARDRAEAPGSDPA